MAHPHFNILFLVIIHFEYNPLLNKQAHFCVGLWLEKATVIMMMKIEWDDCYTESKQVNFYNWKNKSGFWVLAAFICESKLTKIYPVNWPGLTNADITA